MYVLNLNNTSGPPTVEYYNTATGKQLGTLSDPSFAVLFGIGTDRLGNVFVSNLTTSNVGNVVEFVKGKMPGTQLAGVALGLPGAPTFDKSNKLIISDWLDETIDVFTPPYSGKPATAPLEGSSIWCKLNRLEKHLYCGDADNGSIDVYSVSNQYVSIQLHGWVVGERARHGRRTRPGGAVRTVALRPSTALRMNLTRFRGRVVK